MNIKYLINELKKNFDKEERKEIIQNILNNESEFEVANYRFIDEDNIDEIMKEELLSDNYTLGCCSAWFIADICGLDTDTVEKAQKADSYELLGALMASHIDEVVEGLISNDGYGNHFGHYDGNENKIEGYYYFRLN